MESSFYVFYQIFRLFIILGILIFYKHNITFFKFIFFRTSDYSINTLNINPTGDWISIGCGYGSESKLMVWEWQSETYILNQQSHGQKIKAISYSPDGSLIATGAEDGKVIYIFNMFEIFSIYILKMFR